MTPTQLSALSLPDTSSHLRAGYYVRLDQAREQLAAREAMRAQVEEWWEQQGWGRAPIPTHAPPNLAVLSRNCATARIEDCVFMLLAMQAGLVPCWSSYDGDRMCAGSRVKASYLAGKVITGANRKGEPLCMPHWWLQSMTKREIRERGLRTSTGDHPHHRFDGVVLRELIVPGSAHERLPDYLANHQSMMLRDWLPGGLQRFDITQWYRQAGFRTSSEYYIALLSLAIAHGVLFEDFHGGESGDQLGEFTRTVFQPAFRELEQIFGVKPLITPLPWWREMAYFPITHNWHECGAIPDAYLEGITPP